MGKTPARPPQQSRSRATLARITAAAEVLFAERGYDGATVNDIVARARCSVGAFYVRFSDKDSLLLHIHDAHCRALTERVGFLCDLLHAETATLETMVRQITRALFRIAADRRSLARVFMQRALVDRDFHQRDVRAWSQVHALLRTLFLSRRREIARPDADRAADFILHLIHAAWSQEILQGDRSTSARRSDDAARIDDLTAACLAYLGTGRPARS